MEKLKSWHVYLILAVIVWTLYNVLPTLFFYAQPLRSPIDKGKADQVAVSIVDRVDRLENEAVSWLKSFGALLHVPLESIAIQKDDPQLIDVAFKSKEDAAKFARFLPRAGEYIPFIPAQLQLFQPYQGGAHVTVLRQIGVSIDPKETQEYFRFAPKYEDGSKLSSEYIKLIDDRTAYLAVAISTSNKALQKMQWIVEGGGIGGQLDDLAIAFAKEVLEIETIFGPTSPITKRFFEALASSKENGGKIIARLEAVKVRLAKQIETLDKQSEGSSFLEELKQNVVAIDRSIALLRKDLLNQKEKVLPLQFEVVRKELVNDHSQVSLQGNHPLIKAIGIDWDSNEIRFILYDDVKNLLLQENGGEIVSLQKDLINRMLVGTIADVSRESSEKILQGGETFVVRFDELPSPTGVLVFDLSRFAKEQMDTILDQLKTSWNPTHPDLTREAYPILSKAEVSRGEKRFSLVAYAPVTENENISPGFRRGSIYLIAKGLNTLIEKAKEFPDAKESKHLIEEINQLALLTQNFRFINYPGAQIGPSWEKDYIFELSDFSSIWLKATRENFTVKGSQKFGVLEFSDVEERLLTQNKIDDQIQDELLTWEEEYRSAQVDLNREARFLIPKPTNNPFWENFKLSFVKYFRGDDRKILKWGLDLSGGKTVRVGLVDASGKQVTNPDDLKQAAGELYERINKLGVSERTIRIENKTIALDFPGSQNLSASELIKASAMYFHIVNEKFTSSNPILKDAVGTFLQNVWNEAVVTNRKDINSINEIAFRHLGGDVAFLEDELNPKTDVARILYDHGLRLANPKNLKVGNEFNDTLSSVGMMRGDDFMEWDNQPHPLIFLFHNYALEGSSLTDIRVGYDPMQGNVLSFSIRNSYQGIQEKSGNPRDDFYAWTSQFAEDRIQGTPKESYSQGRGWRMAVLLNGTIISKPSLKAALKDAATISGRFSQREINQLAADLKAGSLSFTPKILSEENVSPELGKEERTKGIVASCIALAAVVFLMVSVYRFAGVIASIAVLFNILILWGVLQNLDAALTLPGIAGIVLTIGMAVDANVLVFERIREEFAISHRLASAIQAGYRKAFSAIIDSNVTTIIAALILIQFDSGPIKGFAVTLIIGIISSMFTALFMTRTFFTYWAEDPKHKELKMVALFENSKIDFLAKTRNAVIFSALLMAVGAFLFVQERHTFFGMDFTGGYSLQVTLQERPDQPSYRLLTKEALLAQGASQNTVQVRELSHPNALRIQLGMGMEEKGYPFYQMPQVIKGENTVYPYQNNPRITWVVDALQSQGLTMSPEILQNLENQWTVMSGQFSDTMRNSAAIGLMIALFCILLYITFRFEWKYAVSAVIALAHDLVITIGILAIFHKLGFPIEIDLQVVGALMTIIGYSLNDTIIIFDRIREDLKLFRKRPLAEIINHSLNVTLSRTIMTSGTTLAVLLSLVLLGGPTLFGFSLVMTIGVVVGTFSSLFIAAPAMLFFHQRELKWRETNIQTN